MKTAVWIPLLLGVAFLVLGLVLPQFGIAAFSHGINVALVFLAIVCIGISIYLGLGLRNTKGSASRTAGSGGKALASGVDTEAAGGRGGNATRAGAGGDGGHARATGTRSVARGGDGGAT